MFARVRIRAALCLALAIANSGPAQAADEGNVHITATPPSFGTEVEVETDTQPGGGAEAPPEPAPPPAAPAAPAAPPAARAPDHDEDPCAKHREAIDAWLVEHRKIRPLEAAIEQIEADPILGYSSESCPANGPCTYSSFSREAALQRAAEEVRQAEDRANDAEDLAHQAGTPDRCLVDPND